MDDTILHELFRKMALIRITEETLLSLFSEGKLSGTTHTSLGQEAVAVSCLAHISPEDAVFSNHRCHGHYIAYTDEIKDMLAEIAGKRTGVCAGRGGSQHLCKGRFFTNGIQGGMLPCAAGYAMGAQINSEPAIAVAFLGDGTWGEGIVYETLNMASLWSIPLLVVVEDNGYAQTTPSSLGRAGSIGDRVRAFAINCTEIESNDVVELYQSFANSFAYVRSHRKPLVHIVKTYRLGPHSKGDDFRDAIEKADWAKKDPLLLIRNRISDQHYTAEIERAKEQVTACLPEVMQEHAEHFLDITRGISSTMSNLSVMQPRNREIAGGTVLESLNAALMEIFKECPDALLLGEDILDPYGGAFKVTKGLSTAFPKRVFSTPISEAGIAGIANGLALNGKRPIVEIMFGDFSTLIVDQVLNHAAKFKWMYNNQVDVPVLFRMPSGGQRGYGPTHSQSMEKLFMGFPNLAVIAPTHYHNPGSLLCNLFESMDSPAIFVENKQLYPMELVKPIAGKAGLFYYQQKNEHLPTIRLTLDEKVSATIICYGGGILTAIDTAMQLMIEDEFAVEIICPSLVSPLPFHDIYSLISSDSKHVVVLDEAYTNFGWSAEVAVQIMSADALRSYHRNVERIGLREAYISSAREVEDYIHPATEQLIAAIKA
ncbi:hypothetical protein LJC48_05180 [Desulfovibrio sp. OttesenSCG-928-C06]|nr:hypothetical protein [Desulfovibrio sp. OttesenSCG-928-C06]